MKTQEEIEILRADALAGDAVAQNDLGCAYFSGDGVAKNLKEAFLWFERSAKQGNKYGQYNTGRNYQYGWGTIKNINLAIVWYEKSAEQGFGKAANMLGSIYEKGYIPYPTSRGIPASPEEAFYWYQKGKNSDEEAKFNLARCYEEGIGTPISLYKACELYKECKVEDAKKKLAKIRETYNPILDTRLNNVDILGNNPFRVLGLYTNTTEREIRANQSKIEAMSRVGKATSFETDHLIPCDVADFLSDYSNKIKYFEEIVQNKDSYRRALIEDNINKCKEALKEWSEVEQNSPAWNIYSNRTTQNIAIAKTKLTSEKERIKYALFWFCDYTPKDEAALKLLSEHKWYEASKIWSNEKNFSAYINSAVMQWVVRNNTSAIISILNLIHTKSLRNEFVSVISNGALELSEEELSELFWDTLFEFPEAELSKYDVLRYGCGKSSLHERLVTEKDKEYNQNKGFNFLKSPIEELLQNAERVDENDFEKGRNAYDKVAKEAPYVLLRIKRLIGDGNYRYKLLCNEIAEKLLNYAIHYNNNNKDDRSAPSTALNYATTALNIAIDDNLRERCEENVSIFKKNKQISSTEKLLEEIDTKFKEFEKDGVNLSKVNKLYSDVDLLLLCLQIEVGKESELYRNESDNIVNAILNIVISICNKEDAGAAYPASEILQKMKNMNMYPQTKERLDKNLEILSHNVTAAIKSSCSGNFCNYQDNKRSYDYYKRTAEENSKRQMAKIFCTFFAFLILGGIWIYLSWNNNFQHFMYTKAWWCYICIGFMSIVALFVIIMWGLEFQDNPYDSELRWIDRWHHGLWNISDNIAMMGAQDGKSYSWPLGIPFQILAIVVLLVGLPIKLLASLATKIK